MNAQDPADLLRNIREEVVGLLFNRYVFRTHQEIVRLNPTLQGRPAGGAPGRKSPTDIEVSPAHPHQASAEAHPLPLRVPHRFRV